MRFRNQWIHRLAAKEGALSAQEVGAVYTDSHAKIQVDAQGTTLETEDKVHTFYVGEVGELVEVPAGVFECVRVRREKEGSDDKTYWYAPGVGKVLEMGGQTEALAAVTVN